ncbi:hypothetical protein AMELA_G00235720 [Ameiurus melas]|uniref:Uncharacterized protein n=1 Tax=Ameiurus melas TaxID=219545 RepID=A0A7J5ZY67_AMEME|nr:hypothetical protein AMELA_G00235720 [Ameiurus melas]
MSALRRTCQRSVGTELSLVDVGNMEDLLAQIRNLQQQVSSLQRELNRLSEERGLTGAEKQQTLHDRVGGLSVCETEPPSISTPDSVCELQELQEGVSEGEEAEPLQNGDEHTPLKVCSVKLMDCRTAPALNTHTTQEEASGAGDGQFNVSFLEKRWKRHGARPRLAENCEPSSTGSIKPRAVQFKCS